MKRKSVFIVLLPIILTTIGLIIFESRNKKEGEVCFKSNCFKVELAVTPEEQKQGLMFRKNLNQDEGILFIFKEEGAGKAILDNVEHEIKDDYAVVIPAGTKHNIVNTSDNQEMKLYTVYSPPEHRDGVIHNTKEQADADDEHFDDRTTE